MSATEESNRGTEDSIGWTEVRASNRHERLSEVRDRVMQEGLRILDRSTVTLGRKIAEGGQGTIYEASYEPDYFSEPESVVVKKFKPLKGISQGHFPDKLWSLNVVNICKPMGFFFDRDESLCMLMPRFSGDLRTFIDSHRHNEDRAPFSEEVAVLIITRLAVNFKALHEYGVYHRDIKAANILVQAHPNLPYPSYVVIGDFENSDGVVGTGFWRAPEILQTLDVFPEDRAPLSGKQLQAADVYSFGMTCYEILTGRTPFDGHRWSHYNLVLSGGRPELPDHVPEPLKNLIGQCWHQSPDSRPSFAEIIALLQESNILARNTVSLQDMTAKQGEASSKWINASPEACLVELKRTLLTPEKLHIAGLAVIPAIAKLERVIAEFISTCEELKSKFGWDSHLRHPSLPFVEYVERRRLVTLMKHLFQVYMVNGGIARGDDMILHHVLLMESNCDHERTVLLASNLLFAHRMYLLCRIMTSILEGEAESELSESEVTYLDKFAIVRAFIKSLVDAGVSRRTTASVVADIGARLYELQRASYGEVRDRFPLKWYYIAKFYPFYDILEAVYPRVFETILLYLGYKISAVSGLSNFLFGYTRYSISGFYELLLRYLVLREGYAFAPFYEYYILWKVWRWKGIFSGLIGRIAFLVWANKGVS